MAEENEGLENTMFEQMVSPRMVMDLSPKLAMKLLDLGAKPGMPIRVEMTGVLTDLTLRDSKDWPGNFSVEVRDVRVSQDSTNAIAKLFYDDKGPENG